MARILIAEDERDIRELIFFTLYFAGHEVITTANGEEAYRTALLELPDLIVMDIGMPRMTGIDACKKIKAEESTRHIPVIFLSAKSLNTEKQAGFEAGAVDYLVKPFAPDYLTERIDAIIAENNK